MKIGGQKSYIFSKHTNYSYVYDDSSHKKVWERFIHCYECAAWITMVKIEKGVAKLRNMGTPVPRASLETEHCVQTTKHLCV